MDTGLNDEKIIILALLVMGEKDYVFHFPGIDEYFIYQKWGSEEFCARFRNRVYFRMKSFFA